MKKKSILEPPDRKQCQAKRPSGNTFMTLGGLVGLIRCDEPPTVIAREKKPNPRDGQCGSMSLCDNCKARMIEQLGTEFATFKPIEPQKESK